MSTFERELAELVGRWRDTNTISELITDLQNQIDLLGDDAAMQKQIVDDWANTEDVP